MNENQDQLPASAHTAKLLCRCLAVMTLVGQLVEAAPPSTGFTYQGKLFIGDVPANGLYDLQFTNYDAATGGSALGGFNTNALPVTNGMFAVTLDFGAVFDGTPRWLEISERTNGLGTFATLAPRQLLAAAPYATYAASAGTAGAVAGLTILQNDSGAPNVIGGSPVNWVASGVVGATIGGGGATNYGGHFLTNSVSANFGTIGGGSENMIQPMALWATIGGGVGNTIQTNAQVATIGGGLGNTIQTIALAATIGGGYLNTIESNAQYAAVGGGQGNDIGANSQWAFIGGGYLNTIQTSAQYGTIGGGYWNMIQTNVLYATIGGGYQNTIQPDTWSATIAGGNVNTIQNECYDATIGGGLANMIQTNTQGATIGGGYENMIQPRANEATIGGGFYNTVQTNANEATIGGGDHNVIQSAADHATVSGGDYNLIQTASDHATIGGGFENTIEPNAGVATIGGGEENTIQAYAGIATISGGWMNVIRASAEYAAIGGGSQNSIWTNAGNATIGGGEDNAIWANASHATIGGGFGNAIENNAIYATIPGGKGNIATSYAFAAGSQAQALHTGAFVWADSQSIPFSSTANNQFAVRASGGVFFQLGMYNNATIQADDTTTYSDAKQLVIQGSITNRQLELGYKTADSANYGTIQAIDQNVYPTPLVLQPAGGPVGIGTTTPGYLLVVGGSSSPAYCNGNSWVNGSDRNSKEAFTAINPRAVLEKVSALPITEWKYKVEADGTEHLGPMAQDFHAAFGLNGADDKHIATVDEEGVALAAIQGLNQKLEETRAENAALRARLEKLERLVQSPK